MNALLFCQELVSWSRQHLSSALASGFLLHIVMAEITARAQTGGTDLGTWPHISATLHRQWSWSVQSPTDPKWHVLCYAPRASWAAGEGCLSWQLMTETYSWHLVTLGRIKGEGLWGIPWPLALGLDCCYRQRNNNPLPQAEPGQLWFPLSTEISLTAYPAKLVPRLRSPFEMQRPSPYLRFAKSEPAFQHDPMVSPMHIRVWDALI